MPFWSRPRRRSASTPPGRRSYDAPEPEIPLAAQQQQIFDLFEQFVRSYHPLLQDHYQDTVEGLTGLPLLAAIMSTQASILRTPVTAAARHRVINNLYRSLEAGSTEVWVLDCLSNIRLACSQLGAPNHASGASGGYVAVNQLFVSHPDFRVMRGQRQLNRRANPHYAELMDAVDPLIKALQPARQ